MYIGIAAFVGHSIFSSVGAIKALAVTGFALLLMQISYSILDRLKSNSTESNRSSKKDCLNFAIELIKLGSVFAALAGSQAICNSFLPHISYTDTLKVFWTAHAIFIGMLFLCKSSLKIKEIHDKRKQLPGSPISAGNVS